MIDSEVVRREENEQCGYEIMRKRRGTMVEESQQELSGLLQVIGEEVGEEYERLWFGKMAEEREQVLSYLREVIVLASRREDDEGRCNSCLHEKCREELSGLFKMILLQYTVPGFKVERSRKRESGRSSTEEVVARPDHTSYYSDYKNHHLIMGCI